MREKIAAAVTSQQQCENFGKSPFQFFREINLQCNSLVNKVSLTDFLQKIVRGKWETITRVEL